MAGPVERRWIAPGSTATTPVASAVPWVFAFAMQAEQSIVVDPKSPGGVDSPHGLILFDGVRCDALQRSCDDREIGSDISLE